MSESSKSKIDGILVGITIIAIGIGFTIYGTRRWMTPVASDHGSGIDSMMNFLLVTTGAMFLVGHVLLGIMIFQAYRRGSITLRMSGPKTERIFSIALGVLMTLIAEGGVLAIGLPVFDVYFNTPPPEDAVKVEVTGQQFAWNIRYPGPDGEYGRTNPGLIDLQNPIGVDYGDPAAADDTTAVNQITVPVNRPVKVRLRSRDVIHSFFLPHLRVKQDAVPGMAIDIWFVPTQVGRFEIPCTELCGLGHYRMQGFLNVVSAEDYEQWLASQTTAG